MTQILRALDYKVTNNEMADGCLYIQPAVSRAASVLENLFYNVYLVTSFLHLFLKIMLINTFLYRQTNALLHR